MIALSLDGTEQVCVCVRTPSVYTCEDTGPISIEIFLCGLLFFCVCLCVRKKL